MPRYEYSSGTSNKFWEITVDGSSYTVTYGRIGTVGQTSTKSFADGATAQKKADAAINSKVRKGYMLVEAAELEEEQAAADERLVLADKLQEAGDPRGRLIAIQHEIGLKTGNERAALRRTEAKLLEEHAGALLGPLVSEDARACSSVEWKLGFWDRVKVASDYDHEDTDIAALLKSILEHPSAAYLDHLHMGIPESVWDGESDWEPQIEALVEVGAPELTSLELADYDDNAEISWCEIGDMSGVWKAAPKLERLLIRGVGVTFGAIDAPNLTRLEIISGGLPAEPVQQLGRAKLPALVHLEVYLGTSDYGASTTIEDCAGILRGDGLPALTTLGLKNGEIMNELAAALVTAPIVKQLKALDLSMGTMTDDGARALLRGADAFRHLEDLDLRQNYLSTEMCDALIHAFPKAMVYGQKQPDEYYGETYYYTSVAE